MIQNKDNKSPKYRSIASKFRKVSPRNIQEVKGAHLPEVRGENPLISTDLKGN